MISDPILTLSNRISGRTMRCGDHDIVYKTKSRWLFVRTVVARGSNGDKNSRCLLVEKLRGYQRRRWQRHLRSVHVPNFDFDLLEAAGNSSGSCSRVRVVRRQEAQSYWAGCRYSSDTYVYALANGCNASRYCFHTSRAY